MYLRCKYLTKYDFIALFINMSLLTRFFMCVFKIFFGEINTFREYDAFFQVIILVLPLTYFCANSIKANRRDRFASMILIIVAWLFFMLTAFITETPNIPLIKQTYIESITHVVFPILIIFFGVDDISEMLRALERYKGVCVLTCGMYFFTGELFRDDYLSLSYIIFIPCAISLVRWIKENSSLNGVAFAVITMAGFLFAGRGFLLCVIFFFCFYTYIMKGFGLRNPRVVFITILICFILVLVIGCLQDFADIFPDSFSHARIIEFARGEKEDNSRIIMWGSLLSEFMREPFRIRGILTDREFLISVIHKSGFYSHNFIVEILFEFGVLGCFLIIIMFMWIIRIIKSLTNRVDDDKILMFSIFFTLFICKMSISSSYLVDLTTGMFLGFMLTYSKDKYMTDDSCQSGTTFL